MSPGKRPPRVVVPKGAGQITQVQDYTSVRMEEVARVLGRAAYAVCEPSRLGWAVFVFHPSSVDFNWAKSSRLHGPRLAQTLRDLAARMQDDDRKRKDLAGDSSITIHGS